MRFSHFLHELRMFIGLAKNTTSHSEKIISALGGGISIVLVFVCSQALIDAGIIDSLTGYFLVSSMGATAVLLFAVPHGALSQPWAVVGGHLVSAFIGVTIGKYLGNDFVAAGLSVGLAIGAMYYLRCVHPPGGATALTAVVGGQKVMDLGYSYLFMPILSDVVIILSVALAFNLLFHWRRYPAHLSHRMRKPTETPASEREFELTQEDFAAAMLELDSYVDITADGLTELLELAKQHAEKNITHPKEIIAGHIYSNGKLGKLWSIRQVVDAAGTYHGERATKDQVIFKVLAGNGSYDTGICLREELQQWARFEVVQHNQQWLKVEDED
jgi:CBS-domain-containing membrane protein